MLITTHCTNLNTKCTHTGNHFKTTTGANVYNIPYLHSWGFSQSVPRKLNDTPRLATLQTPVCKVALLLNKSASKTAFAFEFFRYMKKYATSQIFVTQNKFRVMFHQKIHKLMMLVSM